MSDEERRDEIPLCSVCRHTLGDVCSPTVCGRAGVLISPPTEEPVKRVPVAFRYDAINPAFLKMMAEIGHYASEKYGSWSQYMNARLTGDKSPVNHIYEHLRQYVMGERYDHFEGDVGRHLVAVAYNAMMEWAYYKTWGHLKHPLTIDPSIEPVHGLEIPRRREGAQGSSVQLSDTTGTNGPGAPTVPPPTDGDEILVLPMSGVTMARPPAVTEARITFGQKVRLEHTPEGWAIRLSPSSSDRMEAAGAIHQKWGIWTSSGWLSKSPSNPNPWTGTEEEARQRVKNVQGWSAHPQETVEPR